MVTRNKFLVCQQEQVPMHILRRGTQKLPKFCVQAQLTQTCEWFKRLKNDRLSVDDDERSERPSTNVTQEQSFLLGMQM